MVLVVTTIDGHQLHPDGSLDDGGTMTDNAVPRTEAGKRLWTDLHDLDETRAAPTGDYLGPTGALRAILDIEQEAATLDSQVSTEGAGLPDRVVVDDHGHYWRDYGTHLSMCPVSDENVATVIVAAYLPQEIYERRAEWAAVILDAADKAESATAEEVIAALAATQSPAAPEDENHYPGCEGYGNPEYEGRCFCAGRTVKPALAEADEARGLEVDIDTLDRWQEEAESIGVAAVAHFDREHTKAEHADALRNLGKRARKLAASIWQAGHRLVPHPTIEGGQMWNPPTRYMRENADLLAAHNTDNREEAGT